MTISCSHCGAGSKVVLTRRTVKRTRVHGKMNNNIERTRQCIKCRYKWKTKERTIK